ncbi:MAG TPA: 30S ribosomal protein S9 [Dehalococcoidales bacterium]|nr:30S ribosomal protein S9 [Dehalococcoidales bacterium]
MEETYFNGTGRRKTAVASVRLIPGKGAIVVNGTPYEERFTRTEYREMITKPLTVTDSRNKYNVVIKVVGGGMTGQAAAISHGIARALLAQNEENKLKLRANGLLTRDSRAKERKKAGLRKARKAPQYTKR